MASLTERKPGVWFARVFVPATSDAPPRQVGRLFRGNKKAVRAEVVLDDVRVPGSCLLGGKEKLDAK
ncbi:MAG: hypothetical protein M3Q68_01680, partial [Actinomycetota bacterium]|nr:hypothetical protein [Actinomycetota bacterium]